MEPVTHFMTGAVLSRAGFNRKAAYATLAMTLAAELPDIDYVYRLGGPLAYFQHHRGWTHSLWALPLEAAFVVGIARLVHWWRSAKESAPAAPVRWGWLFIFSWIALLSHLLLDYTNNYGVRPFAPWNPRWYEASLVFIAEPLQWLFLLGALLLPSIFGLVANEVGSRRSAFRGQGLAIAALVFSAVLWVVRDFEHNKAVRLAEANEISGEPVLRVAANPYPVNPFKWQVVIETPKYFRLGVVDTLRDEMTSDPSNDLIRKPPTTLATLAAKRSWLGEIYLDWSRWPVVREQARDAASAAPGDDETEVTFDDLRFRYSSSFLDGRMRNPLRGIVTVNSDHRVVEMQIDGSVQKQGD
ncbi:MAG: metal-dependent hydrolase [Acidobacteriaceae bacterium]|nr:metal-dependent hydrolase [Acidobacteriaceae bacterium]